MRFLIPVFALTLLMGTAARSQYAMRAAPEPLPDVLNPSPRMWWLGIEAGVNINRHPGDFVPECKECTFSDAKGTGFVGGIQVEHLFMPGVGVAVKALYDDKHASTSTIIRNASRLTVGGAYEVFDVERTVDVRLAYFTLNPVIELFPLNNLYLQAGPGIGFVVDSRYSAREKSLDPGIVYEASGTNEQIIGTQEWVDIQDARTLRIDLRAGIGYNLRLSYAVILAPEIQYELPLTLISSDDNWKAQTIRANVVLKFSL